MMKNREYFEANVVMAVEIEYEYGGRNWNSMKGSEVKAYCDEQESFGNFISDIDYCTKQDDEWCRKVLNTAYYNWEHNRTWWNDTLKLTSLWELTNYIIDNGLVA